MRTDTADLVELSPMTIEQTLEALVRGGILARAVTASEAAYLPARDLDGLRVEDVRAALRKDRDAESLRAQLERHVEPGLLRLLRTAEEPARDSGWNLTLRELAALVGRSGTGPEPEPARAQPRGPLGGFGRPPVADAK